MCWGKVVTCLVETMMMSTIDLCMSLPWPVSESQAPGAQAKHMQH